jgi:hypothetical protein
MQNSQIPSDFHTGIATSRELANLAKLAGLPVEGDELTPELHEFALLIMEKCAGVGDHYSHPKRSRNAGDAIRRLFGL